MAEDIQSNIRINFDTSDAMANIKMLQTQISAFHTSMAKAGAASAAASANMQQNLINSINAGGKFAASITRIKTTTETFTESLEKNKLSLGQYFKYSIASTKSFGQVFQKEFDTINKVARERVKDLQTQYIKLGRDASGAMTAIKVRPLALDMENLGTKTQIAAQRQALLNQLLKQGSTNLLNFGKNTQWAGRQLMVGFTIPLAMMGAAATKAYQQMEDAAIKFRRVYGDTNTTLQETNSMVKQVQTLASAYTQYGVAVSDTMNMASQAAAMGKTGRDLLQQVNNANKLAVLGGVDQQKSLETTISLTNAFSISSKDLSKNIDFLNAVENQTVLNIDDMTTAIPKAAPVIKQLGGNVKDLAFFLTAMKEGGINASEGANAIKSGLASLINPTSAATKMLSGFGINIKDIVQKDKGNLRKTVLDFAQALDKLDPLSRAQAIEKMFGKFQFARISTLFKNVIDQGSQANKVLELSNKTTGELAYISQQEMKKMSDSPLYKFQKAIADLQATLAPIGEQFMKVLTPLIKFASDLAKGFNNLPEALKGGITTVVGLVAGLGPILLMTFGLLANGVANIIKGFSLVKNLFNRTANAALDLGSEVNYMTETQIKAAAVASSLDQIHGKLKQTLTSEASAVNQLAGAYERAIAAQVAMGGFNLPGIVKRVATGGHIIGPGTTTSDSIPAMLSNGEYVLRADAVKKIGVPTLNFLNAAKFNDGGEVKRSQSKTASTSGLIAAHGNQYKYLSIAEAIQFGLGLEPGSRARNNYLNAKEPRNVYSNLVFGMPGFFNSEKMSGTDSAKWIREHPAAFGSYQEKLKGIDPHSPGMLEFGKHLADELAKAGSEAIKNGHFYQAVETAINKTSDKTTQALLRESASEYHSGEVVSATSGKVHREGFSKLKNYIRQRRYARLNYNQEALDYEQSLPDYQAMQNETKKSFKINSPSRLEKELAEQRVQGFIQGIEKNSVKVQQAGEELAQQATVGVKIGSRRASSGGIITPGQTIVTQSGRRYRRATRPADLEIRQAEEARLALIAQEQLAMEQAAAQEAAAKQSAMNTMVMNNQPQNLKGYMGGVYRLSGKLRGLGTDANRMKIAGVGMGLSTAVGMASMIPGPVGNIANSIAGPVMAISTLTSMFPGIISGFGALLPVLAPLAPALGIAALAVGGLVIASKMAADAEKARIKQIGALGHAAELTSKKLEVAGNLFGVKTGKSYAETAKVTKSATSVLTQPGSISAVLSNKAFQKEYADTIQTLSKTSDSKAKVILQALSLQLSSQGFAKKNVKTMITALQQEAGKTNISLDFNALDLKSKQASSIMLYNIQYALKKYSEVFNLDYISRKPTTGKISGFNLGPNTAWAKAGQYANKLQNRNPDMASARFFVGSTISTSMKTLSKGFEDGTIKGTQLLDVMNGINLALDKTNKTNPSAGISAMHAAIKAMNPDLAKMVMGLKDTKNLTTLASASMMGMTIPQEVIDAMKVLESGANTALVYGGSSGAKETVDAFKKAMKEFAKAIESSKTPFQKFIESQQKTMTKYQDGLTIIQAQEDKINKKYDARLKALDDIQKANDKINEQQKTQLDFADALASGDLGRATQVAQTMQQQNVQNAMDQQRAQIEQQRNSEISSVRDPLGRSRATLEKLISDIQDTINLKTFWNDNSSKHANGGLIKGYATGGMVKYFANGGFSNGTDTVPAMLTPGEFVVKKAAVDRIGLGTLNSINNGTSSDGSVYNYSINVSVATDANPNDIANAVMRQIKNIDRQRIGSVRLNG